MAQNMAAPAPPQGLQPQNYLEYAVYCYLQVWGMCESVGGQLCSGRNFV